MNHDHDHDHAEATSELRAENQDLRRRLAEMERRIAKVGDDAAGTSTPKRGESRVEHELERGMRLALQGAVDFVVIATNLEGRITGWNVGARNVLGWDEGEVLGLDASFIWEPEDRAAGLPGEEMRLAREEGSGADDRWHLTKGGGRVWVSGEMLPMRGSDGALVGYCKVMCDRTTAHMAAERHAASEARWRDVFEHLVEGMLIGEVVREADRIVDWRYLDVNASWEEMTARCFVS